MKLKNLLQFFFNLRKENKKPDKQKILTVSMYLNVVDAIIFEFILSD